MREIQTTLAPLKVKYSYGPYNKFDKKEQWIRITEGCPNNCPYCYEPQKFKIFGIPEIVRNEVKIMDMNLLAKKEAVNILYDLGVKKVNGRVVHYELICGVDFRFMTPTLVVALKKNRFKNIRIAWDWNYKDQRRTKLAIDLLIEAGYRRKDIMVFMICNWKIPYEECLKKLDLLKIWNVQVADCWFDNQKSPNILPVFWTSKQIKDFRRKARKHNHLVNFKLDPEVRWS